MNTEHSLVLKTAPATVRVLGSQAVPAGLVNTALLDLDLGHLEHTKLTSGASWMFPPCFQ